MLVSEVEKMTSEQSPITVIGAGLTGSMIGLLLARRGLHVRIVEMRPDVREKDKSRAQGPADGSESWGRVSTSAFGQLTSSRTRSINLALSHRGISALEKVGLFDQLKPALIPMEGRAVHSLDSSINFQPYGIGHQAIYSVSRADLNDVLLDELEKYPNVRLIFEHKLVRINPDASIVISDLRDNRVSMQSSFVIGADGAFSAARSSMFRLSRFKFSQEYINHAYKELTIPPDSNGNFAMSNPNALHIWPRLDFMLIALPNPDKTFTCTLFAPWKTFESITTQEQCEAFFKANFPDAMKLMPRYQEDFFDNPTSSLITIKLDPWNFKDKVVMMGDAAHAVVPFYGQGMNCGFEDCLVFDEVWEQCGGDYHKAVPEFNKVRQPIGEALAQLSLGNYEEMRAKTASPWWVTKRKTELLLYWLFPNTWIPQYNMVAFTRIPYHIAKKRAEKQDRILSVGLTVAALSAAVGVGKLVYSYWPSSLGSPLDILRSLGSK